MMPSEDEIRKQGVRIIEDFSKMLKDVPETDETHYVTDMRNVIRADKPSEKREGFDTKMKTLAPKWSRGFVVAEKGE
jgi:predicted Asp-tRNA(Asn)/Glu-tRNA(Gln) amidotransferase subunit C